ncbi:hypothetical protein Cs7R123_06050 [Catellatospora sp. TT07R-123]|nr:hypothetical protein Cs7R123_06050 [Catellatospora sp. TT07R-123]
MRDHPQESTRRSEGRHQSVYTNRDRSNQERRALKCDEAGDGWHRGLSGPPSGQVMASGQLKAQERDAAGGGTPALRDVDPRLLTAHVTRMLEAITEQPA